MTSIPVDAIVSRREDLLTNDLSETATVMLDIDRGTYFGVQHVGKAIWDLLESPTRFDELCDHLRARFEVDAETCRREVSAFLGQLREQGLIKVRDGGTAP